MRYRDHGHSGGTEVGNQRQDSLHQFRIQGGGGLVEEHHLRVHSECSRDRHSLLLAARQGGRTNVGLVAQTHQFELFEPEFPCDVVGQPFELARPQRDVVQHAAVWEEVELLEHHADALSQFVRIVVEHGTAVEQDVAAVRFVKAVQASQQGGLS